MINTFKVGIVSLLVICFLNLTSNILAQTVSPATPAKTNQQEGKITNLKTKAGAEISRRLTALGEVMTKLNTDVKLSVEDKTILTTMTQADISRLSDLKAKIENDTDLVTLRSDVQSISKDYRVFALVLPKTGLVVASNAVLSHADKLMNIYNRLQTLIQQAQAAGTDIASSQTQLAEMKKKMDDAKSKAQKTHDLIIPLTPEGYPANKATLQSALNTLKSAREDLQMARKNGNTVMQELKALKVGRTSTTSATPVP